LNVKGLKNIAFVANGTPFSTLNVALDRKMRTRTKNGTCTFSSDDIGKIMVCSFLSVLCA
jgi:hypothetical protein